MGYEGEDCDLERFVKPIDIKCKDKIGDDVGNYKYAPVWKENYIPGKKTR